ncbi:MAG: hypothetical protein NVSMB38_32030 [Ktedonobacteraceae bacterium]
MGIDIMSIQQRFQKSDLFWLLAYPLYQVLGTIRHEASHALVAFIEGAKIEQFVVLPSLVRGQIAWGYVSWSGRTDWVPLAAPYLCDLLTYLLFFFICTHLLFRRHWVWINVIILGLISPLVNSGYEYLVAFVRSWSDIAQLWYELPPITVHAYFGVTLLLYALGLLALLTRPSLVIARSMPEAEAKHMDC